jgi:hypothetical protein
MQNYHISDAEGRHASRVATHLQSTANHAVDRIVATSANANHFDASISSCKAELYFSTRSLRKAYEPLLLPRSHAHPTGESA